MKGKTRTQFGGLSDYEAVPTPDFVSATFTSLGAQLVSAVLVFSTTVFAARILGPEDNGAYNVALLVATILPQLLNFGISSANVYFAGGQRAQLSELTTNSIALSSAVVLLVAVASLALPYLSGLEFFFAQNHLTRFHMVWVAASIPLSTCLLLFNGIVLGRGRIGAYNLITVVRTGLQLLLLSALVTILPMGLGGAIAAYAFSVASALLLSVLTIRKYGAFRLAFNTNLLRESISYGLRAHLGNLVQFMAYRINLFFVSIFLGAEAVGHYAVAQVVAEGLWLISGSAGQALFPRVAALGGADADRLTPRVTRHVIFIVSVTGLVLALTAKHLVTWVFGAAYLPAVEPLAYLLPGVVSLSIPKVLSNDLAGRGRPELGSRSAVIGLLIGASIGVFLIPRWGLKGAAIASSAGYLAAAIAVLYAFRRFSGAHYRDVLLIKKGDLRVYRRLAGSFLRSRAF